MSRSRDNKQKPKLPAPINQIKISGPNFWSSIDDNSLDSSIFEANAGGHRTSSPSQDKELESPLGILGNSMSSQELTPLTGTTFLPLASHSEIHILFLYRYRKAIL